MLSRTCDYQTLPNVVPETGLPPIKAPPTRVIKPQSANTVRKKAEASLEDSRHRLKAIEVRGCTHTQ